jgi:pimeloyl-ACP methyl ester carboxylesterase
VLLALVLVLPCSVSAQDAGAAQDPRLDNLVHEPGYVACEPGTLGAVVEAGSGPIDMVLVSGFGLGASAFAGFMARNAERYRMLALTLPGFEGTAAPPMPPAGTSYGAQTWTRAATEAVVRLVRERRLERPVLVGHSLNGTQVAAGVALGHPELVRALVLLAGTPRFEPAQELPYWPKEMTPEKRAAFVDGGLAPYWFKTVTRETWVANNLVAGDYSTDEARGREFAGRANAPPLSALVRWLCEYHASDVGPALETLELPLLLVQPGFTEELRADEKRSYLAGFFEAPWRGALAERPHMEILTVEDAGILVMDDRPKEVDLALASFLAREAP